MQRNEVTTADASASVADLYVVPDDFSSIQLRVDQVWNCDEIGIDPNGE